MRGLKRWEKSAHLFSSQTSGCAHWHHKLFIPGESAGFLKMLRPQEGIISERLCPAFALETSPTVLREDACPSSALLTHTPLLTLRGAGRGQAQWGQEQAGHLTGKSQPCILWRSRRWPERARPCVPAESPGGSLWCCPCSVHGEQSRLLGGAGVSLKESPVPGPTSTWPPAPVTSFLLREPPPLRQPEA